METFTLSYHAKVVIPIKRNWLQRLLRVPPQVAAWERRWRTFTATEEQAKFIASVILGQQRESSVFPHDAVNMQLERTSAADADPAGDEILNIPPNFFDRGNN